MPGKNPPTQPLTVGHIPQGWPLTPGKPQSLQTITPGLLDVPPGSAQYPILRGLSEAIATLWQQDQHIPEIGLEGVPQRSWGQGAEFGFLIKAPRVSHGLCLHFPAPAFPKHHAFLFTLELLRNTHLLQSWEKEIRLK